MEWMKRKSATFQFVAIGMKRCAKVNAKLCHFSQQRQNYVSLSLCLSVSHSFTLSRRVHILFGSALNLHILLSCKQMTLKLDNDEQNFFIEQREKKRKRNLLKIAAMTMQKRWHTKDSEKKKKILKHLA